MEQRFERIIKDVSWGPVARSLAFSGILNHGMIEKAVYALGRRGHFAGIREIASVFEAVYHDQINQSSISSGYRADVPEILRRFSNACRPLLNNFSDVFFAEKFKEACQKKIVTYAEANNWTEKTPCEAAKLLLREFLTQSARNRLQDSLIKANEKGHASYEQLDSDLNAILLDLRLDPLINAILEGHEKFPRSPSCKREKTSTSRPKFAIN